MGRKISDQTSETEIYIRKLEAERDVLEDRLTVLCEQGGAPAIVRAMFDLAEEKCGHRRIAARHALTTIRRWIDHNTAELAEAKAELKKLIAQREALIKAIHPATKDSGGEREP